jgi:hypothetical protein
MNICKSRKYKRSVNKLLGLNELSSGKPFDYSLITEPEHFGAELAREGELLSVTVKPILTNSQESGGLLCVQQSVTVLLGSPGCLDLIPYEFP